jgi:hypothetical protein
MEATSDKELEDYYIIEPIPGLRLLKMAYIYGPNASGKSTILNALEFFRDFVVMPLDSKSELLDFKPFLFHPETITQSSVIKIEFIQEGIRYDYEIEFRESHILKEKLRYWPGGKPADVFVRTTNTGKQLAEIRFGSKIKLLKRDQAALQSNTLWNNTVLAAYNKTNINIPEVHRALRWCLEVLLPVIGPSISLFEFTSKLIEKSTTLRKQVIEFMGKADLQISDLRFVKETHKIDSKAKIVLDAMSRAEDKSVAKGIQKAVAEGIIEGKTVHFIHAVTVDGHKVRYELPISQESEGTQRYYSLSGALSILMNEGHVLAIDELETSLHADLMKQFVLLFLANASRSQLIITTHNIHFLDNRDIIRPDSVWFTEKNESGATELFSLADFHSDDFRKGGSIINAYKTGRLGAKPKLSSIFLEEKPVKTNGKKKV